MRGMKAAFYETLQILLGFVGLFFHYLAKLLFEIHPGMISRRIHQGPYYWACVRKRRARGEEEWQEIDLQIGIRPPEGHPYWERLQNAGITPLMAVDSPILQEEPPRPPAEG